MFGVQFHPESILTECGYELLANFLRLAGLTSPSIRASLAASELDAADRDTAPPLPAEPVTF